jgi:hypothetical protein
MKIILRLGVLLLLVGLACGRTIQTITPCENCIPMVVPNNNPDETLKYSEANGNNGGANEANGNAAKAKAEATAIIANNAPAIAVSNSITRTWDLFVMGYWLFGCGLALVILWFVLARINKQVERRNNDSSNGTSITRR